MPDIDQNILVISTQIAAIDERTKAQTRAAEQFEKTAEHRHNNLRQMMESFVPRREIDGMISITRGYAETLANDARAHCDTNREIVVARVTAVEEAVKAIRDNGVWIKRAVIGALLTGSLSAAGYVFHLVFVVRAASG